MTYDFEKNKQKSKFDDDDVADDDLIIVIVILEKHMPGISKEKNQDQNYLISIPQKNFSI